MLKFKKNGIFSRSASEEATASELQEGGVVAVWGSPGSGKTTMAVKIAKYLADKKRNVVLLLCDMTAPMLPCICPASELECERSLGSVLAAAHVTENLVKNNLITHKRLGYLTILGMLKGENEYTYPPYGEAQARELIDCLREIAPYVVIDCGSYIANDILSAVALMEADSVLRLANADLNIGFSKDRVNAQLRQNAENRYRLFTLEYRPPYKPKKFPLEDELRKLAFPIEHSYDTATVLVDAVFYLVITAIQIVAELADVMLLSPDLRAAEKDLKELVADYHFLQEHGIHTVADLQANIERSKAELSTLERERSGISNRIRRPKSPEEQAQNKERRKAVSRQMKPVRARLRRAERILEKSPHLYELLKQEHELEKKARARYKERGR